MNSLSPEQTAEVARAFDGVAEVFETSLENETTRQLREKVYTAIRSLAPQGSSILDLNCGIGIDAVALSLKGFNVTGIDISPKMIQEARSRARRADAKVDFFIGNFEDLSPFSGRSFDLVLSNFGGLDCVSTLERVAQELANVVRPGGHLVAVVMPPICLWEIAAGLARLSPRSAFRRLQKNVPSTGFRNGTFTVYYYSPRKLETAFGQWFKRKSLQGFNIISPPPHASRFVDRFPRLSTRLEWVNQMISGFPILRSMGDHWLMTLQRTETAGGKSNAQPSVNARIVIKESEIHSEISTIRPKANGLDLDRGFEKLLKDKSVVIVGPARTILEERQGKQIDSFDIVVRLNEAFELFPATNELAQDIGMRTDILYCNQSVIRKNVLGRDGSLDKKFKQVCDQLKTKYIVCSNNSLSYLPSGDASPSCLPSDERLVIDLKRNIEEEGLQLKLRLVHSLNEKLIEWLGGNFPRTGLVAIADLLTFDIRKLYVTGMTFFHDGGHLFVNSSSKLHPLKNRDGSWARDASGLGHDSYLELLLFKVMLNAFQHKLEVDHHLKKLLGGSKSEPSLRLS